MRHGDVGADEAGAGQRANRLGEELGRHRQQLVAPAVEAERGERGGVDRRRAAVGDGPAEDAEAPQHLVGELPPLRARAWL